MARNTRISDVSRDAVWAVLADGYTYGEWVVGTRMIRDVDAAWPEPGSRLHYTVGYRPLRHDGHTEVLSMTPGNCLELEAHAWPVGSARIVIELEDAGPGCRIHLVEYPARGSAALLHNPVGDALLGLRNIEALRRLERRARQR